MSNIDIVKNAIADGMKSLMREKTIDKISVSEICERTNLNRRNFYRYFQDKFELVDWIYYHDYLMGKEHYQGWSFWDYWPQVAQSMYADREFYCNAFKYTGQNSFREYCITWLYDVLHPDYGPDFPSEQIERFYIEHMCNMSFDAFVLWLSEDPCMPPDQYTLFFKQMILNNSNTNLRLLTREPLSKGKNFTHNRKAPCKK